jgi:hypothetical protein
MAISTHSTIDPSYTVNTNTYGQITGIARYDNPDAFVIKGQMVYYNMVLSSFERLDLGLTEDTIKKTLLLGLMEKIKKENCVEFTKQHFSAKDETGYAVRIFVVPDTQVRLLRQNKFDKLIG